MSLRVPGLPAGFYQKMADDLLGYFQVRFEFFTPRRAQLEFCQDVVALQEMLEGIGKLRLSGRLVTA